MMVTDASTSLEQQDVYVLPASFAQQRLWFLDQLEPESPTYNISAGARINTPLDVKALEQSINALVQRHEVLRTTFVSREGQPMQVISPRLSIPLPVADLQHLPEAQREAEALRLAIEEEQRPFDLIHGPLLRTTLFKLAPQEHVLLLVVHHIIFDGASVGIFFRELGILYQAMMRGQPANLPELSIQYADFSIWQREWLQGQRLEEHLSYWKEHLAGAPATLELPTDHPRPAVPTHGGAKYLLSFSSPLTEALKALSRQEGVSLYMTLLASFSTLLYRYTGQEDLLLGTVISERRRPELQDLIGFFLNTLVLRTDPSGDPPFRELLKRVREVVLEAIAHQDVPFDSLVKELHPERSLGQNPFFQVLLTLIPSFPSLPSEWALNEGWYVDQKESKSAAVKFDLEIELVERVNGLRGHVEYNSDLFESTTIARLAEHWQMLLEGIVAHPEQRLSELPLLTPPERQQLLLDWNATSRAYPKEHTLPHLFEAQVHRSPEAVALVFEDRELTYHEINACANQLARYLQELGVRPEDRVGICMERSLDMVVGLLAILKAGAAYVPLDPAYPREWLAFMLQDAQPDVLLTQKRFLETLPAQEQIVCLDASWPTIAQQSQENLASDISGENLAYLLYTSGSTGQPKGVLGTHRGALNRFWWMWNTYPFEAGEVCCQKTALSFVDAVWEIFGPLLQGIRTVIISDPVVKDPRQLLRTLAAHSVTRLVLVPSLLRVLLEALDRQPELAAQIHKVYYWISSGEALPVELVLRFRQHLPSGVLLNLYGSSEVAADATYYDTGQYHVSLPSVPIGRPIANTRICLLDQHLQLVPVGVPGEIHIGGDGLARGYFNCPELTTARFIPDPFSDRPESRLYKTGDQARYLADGNLEYLGRLDQQVKIRGYRIELGGIEAVLAQHPTIREAVVAVRQDMANEKRLVAYLVAVQGEAPSVEQLRSYLKERLPAYMLPSTFVWLNALPLTPNGKIDRRALPAPEESISIQSTGFVAPTLVEHHQLIQIWEELLDVQPIGIRDNFFDLGGHSLLAMRLIDRIEQVWGKKIPLATLLTDATIEQLANTLTQPEHVDSVTVKANGSTRPGQLGSSFKTAWSKLKRKR